MIVGDSIVSSDLETGQAFVEHLSQQTLRDVENAFKEGNVTFHKLLSNMAEVEASTTREYRGRYIFELLQNANDAIRDDQDISDVIREQPYRVRIELTEDSLIIANDGSPFQEKDVDSIHQWGKSSKDPNKSIGYKGIGFKSVLEISDSPQVFSSIVQFHFDKQLCYQQVRGVVGDHATLKLPFTYFVFPFSIDEINSQDRELVNTLINGEGYATVIRLPLLESVNPEKVVAQIKRDVDPALLLFLGGIDLIDIWIHGKQYKEFRRKQKQNSYSSDGREIILYRNRRIISRWLVFEAPKVPVKDRELIHDLEQESWKRVKEVGFIVAFPLDNKGNLVIVDKPEPIYVYFPTRMDSGLGIRIHADFFVDAARKSIEGYKYNQWLAEKISDYIAGIVFPSLIHRYPRDPNIINPIIPLSEPQEFSEILLSSIYGRLKDCEFVPTQNGKYVAPKNILFVPLCAVQDLPDFKKYFPSDELLSFYDNCFFPIDTLYIFEEITNFLLKLGATQLSFNEVFKLLDGRNPIPNNVGYADFYKFLWLWRERLDYGDDQEFSLALEKTHCIVNRQGNWIKLHNQLFHAKLRQDTPDIPEFLKVDVVHPDTYDADGRSGATYKLFGSFSERVREYDAPAIIRNAIMPLFKGRKFENMLVPQRVAVYQYLYDYWKSRRGGDPDVNQLVKDVKVHAKWVSNRRKWVWKPIREVYLSELWSGDGRLEKLFSGVEGVPFLYEVNGLDLDEPDRVEWGKFWQWIGAFEYPRVIEEKKSREDTKYMNWYGFQRNHEHANSFLWDQYISYLEQGYSRCPYHGDGYLRLRHSATIEHLGKLITSQDVKKLNLLFEMLAENWQFYKDTRMIQLKCYRAGCYEVSAPVFSHWLYILRNSSWVPAQSHQKGRSEAALMQPDQCWFVPATEDAVVRNMLPTPLIQTDIKRSGYRQYYRDLGMRFLDEAGMEDLIDILKRLPEQYPDPNISVSTGRRSIPKAVGTLTRWVIGRIYNLLTQAESINNPLEEEIPIVALDGKKLRYINPPEPVFFADDRYHSPRWKAYLPFAPLDDNWRDAAEFLGFKLVSEHVKESVDPGETLLDETNTLLRNFKNARPYMLAVINDQRTSATEDAVRYLSNLEIRVVNSLVVNRELTLGEGKIIPDPDARIYLEETTLHRVGSSGRAQRAGVLYIRKGYERYCDVMGSPIAEYLRIPGLADAFVILLDRRNKNGRMRYIDTRKLTEQDVSEMRKLFNLAGVLDEEEENGLESSDNDINDHLIRKLKQELETPPGSDQNGTYDENNDTTRTEATIDTKETLPQQPETDNDTIEFPPLDVDQVDSIKVTSFQPVDSSFGGGDHPRRRGGRGRVPNWERDQRLRDAYGERGERLVYKLEIKRLCAMGVTEPESEVRWLRMDGQSTANHDIDSLDMVDGELVPIIIEVKSTPGNDFRVHMSKEELKCAQRHGKYYRLHRIIDVASSSPKEFIFENLFDLWQRGLADIEPKDTYVILPNPAPVLEIEEEV